MAAAFSQQTNNFAPEKHTNKKRRRPLKDGKKTYINNTIKFAAKVSLITLTLAVSIEAGSLWLQSYYIEKAANQGAELAATLTNPAAENSRDNNAAKQTVINCLGGLYPHLGSYTPEDCCNCDKPTKRICNIQVEPFNKQGIDGYKVSVTVKIYRIFETQEAWAISALFTDNPGNHLTASAFRQTQN